MCIPIAIGNAAVQMCEFWTNVTLDRNILGAHKYSLHVPDSKQLTLRSIPHRYDDAFCAFSFCGVLLPRGDVSLISLK
jgi:hypothetical protein